ncbi:hypothetical protein [Xanthocytophaga flava]|uniref:hypothetical protein n=1 Tax=Xanthocytophaga flava TaxID=3048013 RepID=UPI0028D54E15|nr:hypothetical protein [Xanthocytophaga flavus]MDJ1468151.1 hypothetical protein [Xanthocytophaga flavus]
MANVRQDNVQVNLQIMGQEAKTELDNLQRKADLVNQELKTMKKGSEEFIAKQKELNKVNADMEKLRKEYGIMGMNLQQLDRYAAQLARDLKTLTPGTESFINKAKEFDQVKKRIADVNAEIKGINDNLNPSGFLQKGFTSLKNMVGQLGPAMLAAFSITAIIEFGKAIYNVTSEFQRLETVLATTLGSKGLAKAAMAEIKDLAATTPMSVQEWTDSYVKLINRGITPTREQLVALGDTASSQGKSLDQYIEAFLDAQTGEFERLKEFGIKASKSGDQVTFSFKNQTAVVKNNSEAISEYLYGLGEMPGVLGGMANQAETASGKVSNLGDSWDNLLNTLGSGKTGLFGAVIEFLADMVNMANKAFMSIEQIKESVAASTLNTELKADMEEINFIAKGLMELGNTASQAQIKAAESVKQSIAGTLKSSQNLTEQEKTSINDRIIALDDYIKKQKEAAKPKPIDPKDAEKAAKDADKLRKEQEKAEADSIKRLQDLWVAAIKDDEQREIAQAALRARREVEGVEQSKASANTKKELITTIEESLQSEVSKIQDKYKEKRRKSDEDFAKEYDDRRRRAMLASADVDLVQAQLVADQQDKIRSKKWILTSKDRANYEAEQQVILDMQIKRLETQKQIELENKNLTESEKQLIEAEFIIQKGDLERQAIDERAAYELQKRQEVQQALINIAQTGLQSISDFAGISAQKEIKAAENTKNQKVNALKFELNAKRLNQDQYNAAVQAAEAETEKKTTEIKRRQARIDKQVKLGEAIINTAVAVTAAMAKPAIPPFPSAIAAGVIGALQIAKVASTPLQYAKGGKINATAGIPSAGQLHSNGGIKMIDGATGEHLGEWERGEPYMILSRNTYANNREIVDSLLHSSLYRNGAPIVSRRFEDGGIITTGSASGALSSNNQSSASAPDLTGQMITLLQDISIGVRNFPTLLKAYTVLSEHNAMQQLQNEIDTESSFG